jgi:hypothetical protein
MLGDPRRWINTTSLGHCTALAVRVADAVGKYAFEGRFVTSPSHFFRNVDDASAHFPAATREATAGRRRLPVGEENATNDRPETRFVW